MRYFAILISVLLFAGEIPDWYTVSEDGEYIYGVGSAPKMTSYSMQLQMAKASARADLAEKISVHISSDFRLSQKTKDGKVIENGSERTITQQSTLILKYSKLLDIWENSDGELFVRIGIEKSDLR